MDNLSRKCASYATKTARVFDVAQYLLCWRAKFYFAANFILLMENGSHYANNLC